MLCLFVYFILGNLSNYYVVMYSCLDSRELIPDPPDVPKLPFSPPKHAKVQSLCAFVQNN